MEQPATIGSSVIPIANKLHDIFATISGSNPLSVDLPQVAVVGSQSSGKSSVLEALVGRDFLPRGNDICTRCPLLLQLENCDVDARGEWGEFLHLPGKQFYDFSEIRKEIQAETQKQAGRNKGVCAKQICLKISSPNVLNITLVDLPGITKVPVGDQPSDIEVRVRKMIMSYIKQEACIILAVSPANSDLATSDALQMAKEADPSGIRTIGVITKLDIMDRGTNALNFLQGKVVPLRLGYVGVVNRCQEDINKNRSIREALACEEKFFYDNPIYNGLSQRCGIPQLAKKLNQVLEQHILTVLPKLKTEVKTHLLAVGKELQSYGDAMESKAEQGVTLLNILRRHSEAFTAMVEGKSHDMSTKELSGGARIQYIFQSIFVKSLEEVDPCYDVTDDDIRTAIQNTTGPRNALFVPELPFEVFVTKQIARLLDPSLQCLRLVYEELVKMGRSCEATEIGRFPVLQKRLDEVMRRLLDDGVKLAEKMIEDIIAMEMDYINTAHPNFIGGNKAVELALQQLKSSENAMKVDQTSTSDNEPKSCVFLMEASNRDLPIQGSKTESSNGMFAALGKNSYSVLHSSFTKGSKTEPSNGDSSTWRWGISSIFRTQAAPLKKEANKSFSGSVHKTEDPSLIHLSELPSNLKPLRTQTDSEAVEVRVMKLVLRSYYDIVRKNIEDLVPKAIMHFLVNNTKRVLLAIFIQKLYREGLYDDMLMEDDDVTSKRKQLKELLQVLQTAVQTLEAIEADVRSRGSRSSSDSSSGMTRF